MALLIDRCVITIRDLLPYENDLLETADRERVEIETKIALGLSNVRAETETEVDKILRSGTGGGLATASIANVITTSPLLRWAHHHCLELFYLECFGHQMNERFRAKYEHHRQATQAAKREFLQRGIGVANLPLAAPAAPVAATIDGSLTARPYYFAATWSNIRNQESALGEVTSLVLLSPGGVELTPPSAPATASGWNVYIGQTADRLFRQNLSPIPLSQSWAQTAQLNETGTETSAGQSPDRYLQPQRIFQRG